MTAEPIKDANPMGMGQNRPSGRGLVWALRTLKSIRDWELRAEIERDPETWREHLAVLDRLIAALEADGC